jgi:hypothetical protein
VETLMLGTTLLLYALGAMLMHARLAALVDDVRLSDVPGPTPSTLPVTIAVVVLWPLAVILYTWLALVLLRPRSGARRGRVRQMGPARSGTSGAERK